MAEHRMVLWEPTFRKYVKDYEGDGEWSPSYVQRENIIRNDLASTHYACTCGEEFGTDEEAARDHVRLRSPEE